jgi:hypothetical protein
MECLTHRPLSRFVAEADIERSMLLQYTDQTTG